MSSMTSGHFHYRHLVFFSQLKVKADLVFTKDVVLLITLNIDGAPPSSRSHTHRSHSQTVQTSRLLTSSLSLGIPVPHGT